MCHSHNKTLRWNCSKSLKEFPWPVMVMLHTPLFQFFNPVEEWAAFPHDNESCRVLNPFRLLFELDRKFVWIVPATARWGNTGITYWVLFWFRQMQSSSFYTYFRLSLAWPFCSKGKSEAVAEWHRGQITFSWNFALLQWWASHAAFSTGKLPAFFLPNLWER